MDWKDVPDKIDEWSQVLRNPATHVRKFASNLICAEPVGYYIHPETVEKVAVFAPNADTGDLARLRMLVKHATAHEPLFLTYQELADPSAAWVKVAYSPSLRAIGEALNFFPGQYPGGFPNHASPLAAMLTAGVLGTGLGWGAGKLIGKALPEGYGDNFARTGALIGGLLGAAPGAAWMGTNAITNRSLNSPELTRPSPQVGQAMDGSNMPPGAPQIDTQNVDFGVAHRPLEYSGVPKVKLSSYAESAIKEAAAMFADFAPKRQETPADVNIDHLGRLLWEGGASPQLAGQTMGTFYAAQQIPDRNSRPGIATGHQLGQLAANAAGDYATGYLVGAAINAAIGTPYSAGVFGGANAALGVVSAVVPKLFGG